MDKALLAELGFQESEIRNDMVQLKQKLEFYMNCNIPDDLKALFGRYASTLDQGEKSLSLLRIQFNNYAIGKKITLPE